MNAGIWFSPLLCFIIFWFPSLSLFFFRRRRWALSIDNWNCLLLGRFCLLFFSLCRKHFMQDERSAKSSKNKNKKEPLNKTKNSSRLRWAESKGCSTSSRHFFSPLFSRLSLMNDERSDPSSAAYSFRFVCNTLLTGGGGGGLIWTSFLERRHALASLKPDGWLPTFFFSFLSL
jgi:hypothetical protein